MRFGIYLSTYRAPASDVSSVILCGKLPLKCIGVATRFLLTLHGNQTSCRRSIHIHVTVKFPIILFSRMDGYMWIQILKEWELKLAVCVHFLFDEVFDVGHVQGYVPPAHPHPVSTIHNATMLQALDKSMHPAPCLLCVFFVQSPLSQSCKTYS